MIQQDLSNDPKAQELATAIETAANLLTGQGNNYATALMTIDDQQCKVTMIVEIVEDKETRS